MSRRLDVSRAPRDLRRKHALSDDRRRAVHQTRDIDEDRTRSNDASAIAPTGEGNWWCSLGVPSSAACGLGACRGQEQERAIKFREIADEMWGTSVLGLPLNLKQA